MPRTAASAATWNRGTPLRFITIGSAASDPSLRNWMRTVTMRSRAFCTPTGTSQQSRSRACNAASSVTDNVAAAPVGAPIEATWLRLAPVAALRCGARRSSSARRLSIDAASNFSCSRFFASASFLASSFFFASSRFFASASFLASSFFFASSRLSASAIASTSGSALSGFASAFSGCGSGGLASGGLVSGGLGAGGGDAAAAVGAISGLSDTFAVGSFTVLVSSATLSTIGFGGVFSPVFRPAVIWVSSVSEIMSTGIASVDSILVDGSVTNSHTSSARCRSVDMVSPVRMTPSSRPLLDFRHQPDLAETGGGEPRHHLHDRAVIELAIAAHEDALVEPAAARLRDRLELVDELVDRGRLGAALQEDFAFEVDRDGQRLLVLADALGLGLRQVDRHADREQRRRDHEDDQQHQHDVDHWRHVDVAHDAVAAVAALADRVPHGSAHAHAFRSPCSFHARRSAAIIWRQTRRRTPPSGVPACSPRPRI